MGHINDRALRHLASNARGVVITDGKPRHRCEDCVQTKATQQISRREPDHPAPRPFYRIHMDLFYYPKAQDGTYAALIFKDEWSGHVTVYPLTSKNASAIYEALVDYARRVKGQYGVDILREKRRQ